MCSILMLRGVQTTARGRNAAREAMLQIMKYNMFTKNLLIWWYVAYRETIRLRKTSVPQNVLQ